VYAASLTLRAVSIGFLVENPPDSDFIYVQSTRDVRLGARPPYHPGNRISFLQQKLGQIGAVLACDTGD
jgi:hypothetical protein